VDVAVHSASGGWPNSPAAAGSRHPCVSRPRVITSLISRPAARLRSMWPPLLRSASTRVPEGPLHRQSVAQSLWRQPVYHGRPSHRGLAFTNDYYAPPEDRNVAIDRLTISPEPAGR